MRKVRIGNQTFLGAIILMQTDLPLWIGYADTHEREDTHRHSYIIRFFT